MSESRTPAADEALTIVVPIDDEKQIASATTTWIGFVKKRPAGSELRFIVSRDQAPVDHVRFVTIAEPFSFGAALRAGLAEITTPLVAIVSPDAG